MKNVIDNNCSLDIFLNDFSKKIKDLYTDSVNKYLKNKPSIVMFSNVFSPEIMQKIYLELLNEKYPVNGEYWTNERMTIYFYFRDFFYYDEDDRYHDNLKINIAKFNDLMNIEDRNKKFKTMFFKFRTVIDIDLLNSCFNISEEEMVRNTTFRFVKNSFQDILISMNDWDTLDSLLQTIKMVILEKYIETSIKKYYKFSISFQNKSPVDIFYFYPSNREKFKKFISLHNLTLKEKDNTLIFTKQNLFSNFFKNLFK